MWGGKGSVTHVINKKYFDKPLFKCLAIWYIITITSKKIHMTFTPCAGKGICVICNSAEMPHFHINNVKNCNSKQASINVCFKLVKFYYDMSKVREKAYLTVVSRTDTSVPRTDTLAPRTDTPNSENMSVLILCLKTQHVEDKNKCSCSDSSASTPQIEKSIETGVKLVLFLTGGELI